MPCLSLDFENHCTREISLRKMTLRQYLEQAPVLCVSWAVDDEPVSFLWADDPYWPQWVAEVRDLATRPEWIFSAHNAAYDVRVCRFGWAETFGALSIPQPQRVHCSLELSMAAWPNQPGGYGLANLSKVLGLPPKLEVDLTKLGQNRILAEEYCKRDTANSRAIRKMALDRLPDCEVRVAEMANRVRRNYFMLSATAVESAVTQFGEVAADAVRGALEHIGRDGEEAFGWDEDGVKSVKPQKVKDLLLLNLGFETPTISLKKINPARLMQSAEATVTLREVARANKSLSHKRRVRVFRGTSQVDMELGYARAHTYRYSSPAVGKGVNLHNLPKHDKTIAKPTRKLFTLPSDLCFVRADAANVEYRVECWLTRALVGSKTFDHDLLADPYASFWFNATGQLCSKTLNVIARQVAKAAVLGLGYKMGVGRWMVELAKFVSDPVNKLSLTDIEKIAWEQGWTMPNDRWVKGQKTKYAIPDAIAVVAYHTRQLFHHIHPEFFSLGRWLEELIIDVCRASNPDRAIEGHYRRAYAPDRQRIDILLDPELDRPTLRTVLGPWPAPTVAWRDIGIHADVDGISAVQAGSKGYRTLHQSILLENVVQSAARNAMVMAKCSLENLGYMDILSVHDELLLIVPRNPESVLKAKADLLKVMGPGNDLGWSWAFMCNPAEISVSQSMYEEEQKGEWWDQLAAGHEELLHALP